MTGGSPSPALAEPPNSDEPKTLALQMNKCYLYIEVVSILGMIISRVLPVAFAIVFLAGVHGAELVMAAEAAPSSPNCGCTTDCACRSPEKGCGCSNSGPSIKARCGCGGSEPQHAGVAPSWDTVFAATCSTAEPLLLWSPAPEHGDPQALRLPFEHEHPPRRHL